MLTCKQNPSQHHMCARRDLFNCFCEITDLHVGQGILHGLHSTLIDRNALFFGTVSAEAYLTGS